MSPSCARTIACLGGGPGGLFFAIQIKRADPSVEIRVLERNPPDATYGFGVVFSEGTLESLREADPQTCAAMDAAGVTWDDIEIRRDDRRIRCGGQGFAAIARRTLLRLLQDEARRLGVEMRFDTDIVDVDALMAEHDLVLGADGANSRARASFEHALEPSIERGAAKFIWFATTQPFDALTFAFERNQHGWFGVHAYPFEDGTSTFIIETDETTWRASGLSQTPTDLPVGASDEDSMAYCERLFASHLDGHPLLGNNSRWMNFPTLRARRWHCRNLALMGDAAHTAHFSVGSGTRMAMEDAVALAHALTSEASLEQAFAAYEDTRQPATERIQRAARPSIGWWERFGRLEALPPEQFAFNFLTRTGRITGEKLAVRDPDFVALASTQWLKRQRQSAGARAGRQDDDPLHAPLALNSLRLAGRLSVAMAPQLTLEVALADAHAALAAGLALASIELTPEMALDGVARAAPAPGQAIGAIVPAAFATEAMGKTLTALGIQLLELRYADDEDEEESRSVLERVRSWWPASRVLAARLTVGDDDAGSHSRSARMFAQAGADLVVVRPASSALAIAALLACERVRVDGGIPTLLDGLANSDEAATALVAGRADLCRLAPVAARR
jgi:salicyloyl-CoA 5-hydroxylase